MGSLKQRRFSGQTHYTALLATKPLAVSACLTVHGVLHPSSMPVATGKLGLIVGKRFAPQSHLRNRIKRVLRAQCTVETLPGACFVVRLRAPVGQQAYTAAFAAQATQLWHTARSVLLARTAL